MVLILSLFLLGPSRLFQIPDNLITMGIGLALLGMTCQVYIVVMVVIAIQPLYSLFPGQNNRISKLFGACRQISISFAFFSAPFYASGVTSISSYETTCDSVGFIVILFMIVFLGIHLSHRE